MQRIEFSMRKKVPAYIDLGSDEFAGIGNAFRVFIKAEDCAKVEVSFNAFAEDGHGYLKLIAKINYKIVA